MDPRRTKHATLEGTLPLCVRQDIQVEKQTYGGETFYVAKDPLTLRYYRLKELEYFIFTLLDGTRDVKQIQEEVAEKFHGLAVSDDQIKEFILILRNFNFLEAFGPHSSHLLYQRVGQKKRLKLKQTLMSFFFIKIPLVDPDQFFNRIYPHIKVLFSRPFYYLWLFSLAVLTAIVVSNFDAFIHQMTGFFNMENLALVWISIMIIKTLHELGHSLLCKHYGGEVHELGILLIVFTPWMYTNVTDAWIFQKGRQRFLVTMAGIMTELFFAALAAVVWWITAPGILNSLCHNIILVCSIDNIMRNGNPLLRYDGYYALSDYLEIPNLRMRALGYLKLLLRKHLLHLPIADGDPFDEPSSRRRLVYLIYGPLSFLYLNFILLVIAGFVAQMFFVVGVSLAFFMIFRSFIWPIHKGIVFTFQNRAQIGYGKPVLMAVAAVPVALLLFLIVYRPHLDITAPCAVEPMEHAMVRTEAEGVVTELSCRQGDRVRKGQVLAVLKNDELMTDYELLRLQHADLLQQRQKTLGLGQHVEYDQTAFEIARVEKELANLARKIDKLKVVALADGVVLTPSMEEKRGNYLAEGAALCETGFLGAVQVRVVVSESYFSEIRAGQKVSLKVNAYADRVFHGAVTDISPARVQSLDNPALSSKFGGQLPTETVEQLGEVPKLPFFQVTMQIDNAAGLLKTGMTGFSKIYGERRPLIVILWNKILRLLKPDRILMFSS